VNSIENAQTLVDRLTSTKPNLTQIRAIAKEYGKNQETADYLWMHGETSSKLLSLLILDLKAMNNRSIEIMISDIEAVAKQDQRQLCDWMIANVIMKKSSLKNESMKWLSEPSIIKQRVFWSVQARTIKAENQELNKLLLESLEKSMAGADEMVQETMNWCAAQIGIEDEGLRGRCIQLGERLTLYKNYPVSKGCTSPYLPIWIGSVVGKKEMGNEKND
jgi:3-methyladenine DNA glycosylase AlkD